MGYDSEKWSKRLQYRSDLSGFVYHMTKDEIGPLGTINLDALHRLLKIIKERKLNGSSTDSGFITGNRKAICFQDAPISGVLQNILHENNFKHELLGKTRYSYYGIAFPKQYIFNKGARPVFYEEKEKAKKILPPDEYWRIVDFNLNNANNLIDWTHEREWRLPSNEFYFDLCSAVILVPNQDSQRKLIENLPEEDLKVLMGIIQISPLVY